MLRVSKFRVFNLRLPLCSVSVVQYRLLGFLLQSLRSPRFLLRVLCVLRGSIPSSSLSKFQVLSSVFGVTGLGSIPLLVSWLPASTLRRKTQNSATKTLNTKLKTPAPAHPGRD